MNDLHACLYVSTASRLLRRTELDLLLLQARQRNTNLKISGFLIYCDGNFMQYIEGPRVALMTVYADICADARHQDFIELASEPVAEREFAGWSMAYAPAHMEEFRRLSEAPWSGLDRARSDPVDAGSGFHGSVMLREFWSRHRHGAGALGPA